MSSNDEVSDTPGQTGTDGQAPAEPGRAPLWSRIVIFGAAGLALLLVGATVGVALDPGAGDERRVPGPDSVAVGFAQDMTRHHMQAVAMANWAQANSTDPAIKQLAFDIASTQLEQIGRMRGWLMLWDQPTEVVGEPMAWMEMSGSNGGDGGMHGGMHDRSKALMPGMATRKELDRLHSLSGEKLDVYFLQLMLRHHLSGIKMARYAKKHSDVSAVVTLASSMVTSQRAEIKTMRNMLAQRGAEPLPAP